MADFSFLDEMQVNSEDLSEITLYNVDLPNGEHPVLIGRLAGESNPAYMNEILKQSLGRRNRSLAALANVKNLQRNRDLDRKLYPLLVITGWRNVCDVEGKDVPFSSKECVEFFQLLPDFVMDDVRNHFADPGNFSKEIDVEGAVEKGKKLPGGSNGS